jgi:hypothetical protein
LDVDNKVWGGLNWYSILKCASWNVFFCIQYTVYNRPSGCFFSLGIRGILPVRRLPPKERCVILFKGLHPIQAKLGSFESRKKF